MDKFDGDKENSEDKKRKIDDAKKKHQETKLDLKKNNQLPPGMQAKIQNEMGKLKQKSQNKITNREEIVSDQEQNTDKDKIRQAINNLKAQKQKEGVKKVKSPVDLVAKMDSKSVPLTNANNSTQKEGEPKKIALTTEMLTNMKLQQEEVDFLDDSRAALLAEKTPFAKALLLFLLIFIMVGSVWCSKVKLDEVTRSMGRIIPASKVQTVQNLEGGMLTKVNVKEGEEVKQGQILAQLDQTIFSSQFLEAKSQYITLLAKIDRLKSERDNLQEIYFSGEVIGNENLMKREHALFDSRKQYLQNTLKNLQKSYDLAFKELSILKPLSEKEIVSNIEILRLEREVAQIKGKIDSAKNGFKNQVLEELTKVVASAEMLNEKLAALKDRMKRTTIRSPASGIVKQVYVSTFHEVIKPGMPILDIVPLNDQLVIEAQIKPSDIAFIKIGQKVTVRITAYDYAIYGNVSAVVEHISADTSADRNGNSYYEVNLKVDKNYLGDKPDAFPLKPGMVAMVDTLRILSLCVVISKFC